MDAFLTVVLVAAVLALILAQLVGAIAALFFGRKFPWIWFALAVMVVSMKVTQVALFRQTDGIRGITSLVVGFIAACLALVLQRRFTTAVLLVGGFFAAGLTVIQVLGPLLNPAPQWLVITILVLSGVAGAVWTRVNRPTATIVLSALIGAGVLADLIVDALQIDETLRFQVYAVLALIGIGFQFWRERRGQRGQPEQAGGAVA